MCKSSLMELSNIIGVVFAEMHEDDTNQLLSQMSKSQLETGRDFFYIFSENKKVKDKITKTCFRDLAFSGLSNDDEVEILKGIDYIISSKEFKEDKALQKKTIIIPSEESFYFDIEESMINKIL
jgi:hypothetical protein